jgi:hypothetical protein
VGVQIPPPALTGLHVSKISGPALLTYMLWTIDGAAATLALRAVHKQRVAALAQHDRGIAGHHLAVGGQLDG